MFSSRLLSKTLVICLILLTSSCGWQLRGYHTGTLNISDLSLNTDKINHPQFSKVFKDTLASEYKIQISAQASVKTRIDRLSETKRVSSKDRAGDASEYEHTITLTITTELEQDSLTQSFISVQRQSYDQDNLLSSDMQERSAKRQAYQELTRQYASYLSKQLSK